MKVIQTQYDYVRYDIIALAKPGHKYMKVVATMPEAVMLPTKQALGQPVRCKGWRHATVDKWSVKASFGCS